MPMKLILQSVVCALMPLAAMACDIPVTWSVQAADPCKVMEELKAAWWKVEQVRAFERWTREKAYQRHDVEEIWFLTIIEEADAFPCGAGLLCAGTFTPGIGFPALRFSRKHALQYDTFFHELSHAAYWSFQFNENEWAEVDHGTMKDPFVLALRSWVGWIWSVPDAHPYHPGWIPISEKASTPKAASSSIVPCGVGLDGVKD